MRHESRSIQQLLNDDSLVKQAAPVAMTTSATITSAAILGKLITGNEGAGAAATYTMPTGAVFAAIADPYFSGGWPIDYAIEFTVINISTVAAEIITLAGATGMTAVGNMVVSPNVAAPAVNPVGTFRVRKTAPAVYSFYRVG
jgi:hypothetical protein